jgi:hypothetical protein
MTDPAEPDHEAAGGAYTKQELLARQQSHGGYEVNPITILQQSCGAGLPCTSKIKLTACMPLTDVSFNLGQLYIDRHFRDPLFWA